ncbi:MAG: holo-ACP synthase [Planctomycetaceae bacterium]|jgi:holo-[acyl-carrier protein] synthase|nr:holo-ACP synthase [Planctomycetaceae bacterium]
MMQTLGIGADITECGRIARMLEQHRKSFTCRVFTERENDYCVGKQEISHYAGRWAAKEAIFKALDTGWLKGTSWRDIEILNAPNGKPYVVLSGGMAEIAQKKKIKEVQISISHCKSHAVAFAVAFGEG